jgi:hypothetical protein
MTEDNYICPFFPGKDGNGILCYREKCMAWRENRGWLAQGGICIRLENEP